MSQGLDRERRQGQIKQALEDASARVPPPCWICNKLLLSYADGGSFLEGAIDVGGTFLCPLAGCHVNTDSHTIWGPTAEEYTTRGIAPMVDVQFPAAGGVSTGAGAIDDLISISKKGGAVDNREVIPGEDALDWFNRIIGGSENAEPMMFGETPGLRGPISEGGTAYYRPITDSGNPAVHVQGVPGTLWEYLKFHFPFDE